MPDQPYTRSGRAIIPTNSAKCKAWRRVRHSPSQKYIHLTSEKNRRQRIKACCERLHALLPNVDERRTSFPSILKDAVTCMTRIRDTAPQSVISQIAQKLENNYRFHKFSEESPPHQKPLPKTRDLCDKGQCLMRMLTTGMTAERLSGAALQTLDTLQSQTTPAVTEKPLCTVPCKLVLYWRCFRPSKERPSSSIITENADESKSSGPALQAPFPKEESTECHHPDDHHTRALQRPSWEAVP